MTFARTMIMDNYNLHVLTIVEVDYFVYRIRPLHEGEGSTVQSRSFVARPWVRVVHVVHFVVQVRTDRAYIFLVALVILQGFDLRFGGLRLHIRFDVVLRHRRVDRRVGRWQRQSN